MGFLSWLFGKKDSKPTEDEIETAEEVEELIEEVAESVLDMSPLDKVLDDGKGDFLGYLIEFDQEGSAVLSLTVEGSKGTREYEKKLDDIEAVNEYVERSAEKLKKYYSQGKSLYQAMGYLNLSRVS